MNLEIAEFFCAENLSQAGKWEVLIVTVPSHPCEKYFWFPLATVL